MPRAKKREIAYEEPDVLPLSIGLPLLLEWRQRCNEIAGSVLERWRRSDAGRESLPYRIESTTGSSTYVVLDRSGSPLAKIWVDPTGRAQLLWCQSAGTLEQLRDAV